MTHSTRSFRAPLATGALLAALLAAAGCEGSYQTSSGTDYLSGYSTGSPVAAAAEGEAVPFPENYASYDDYIDARVAEAATIEPTLRFPAKIGLARIGGGSLARPGLTTVPPSEGAAFRQLSERLGPGFGSFVPVNPLITAMATADDVRRPGLAGAIDEIRIGAARQHVDYVFVYESNSRAESDENAISLADLTIIGLYVLPTRSQEAEAVATGVLIDVRTGYPYAEVAAAADKEGLSRAINSSQNRRNLQERAEEAAVRELTGEVEKVMRGLKAAADAGQSGAAG